ncbi:MAG TPA: ATP synthase F1 subunit gamma [Firmicutes bacterium]|nr:ATP synthase F1 subunit gamma [Bacillota bacterium]
MSNIREIKRRIRAISNIQHVTGAMKMVAASRLRRAQSRVWAARPYAQKTAEVAGRLALSPNAQTLPLVASREVKKTAYVLIVGDKGLAGAYNANLIHLTEDRLVKEGQPAGLVVVGRKGLQYFRRRSVEILKYYVDIGDEPDLSLARELARQLMDIFLSGQVDEVNLIYARFISALRNIPQVERLLPIETPSVEGTETIDYIYEPEPVGVLEAILPRYCEVKVYQALLEAKASELSARMVAMESATKNSAEMIEQLTLSFNKARQAAITTELLEVATGAEALKAQG